MTGKENDRHQYQHEYPYQEDEIHLIDLLGVIWKWKWLIIAGVVICVFAAAVISFQMPKIYEISMFIEPGIIGVKNDGNFIYIDSSENISGNISASAYKGGIIEALHLDPLEASFEFKSTVAKNANLIKITSRWKEINTDIGLKVMNKLLHFLLDNYRGIIEQRKGDYNKQIITKENEIRKLEAQIKSMKGTLQNIEQIMGKLEKEVSSVKNNTEKLMKERELLLKKGKTGAEMSLLLYTTTIQQNISYFNQINYRIYTFKEKEEETQQKIINSERDISTLEAEIKTLNAWKELINNIKIIQQPKASPNPVAPKRRAIVLLTGMVSLFMLIFLAFFIEYIRNAKSLNKAER